MREAGSGAPDAGPGSRSDEETPAAHPARCDVAGSEGAAVTPGQKIDYAVGKWQIERLLGRYRDREGAGFHLGHFHDQLLSYGSLPVSIIEWLMFDDEGSLQQALASPRQ